MATIERNKDGSSIVRLSKTIKVNGEETDRVTIPPIKGKHMRMCPFVVNDPHVKVGTIIDFAALVVMPAGAVDEMSPEDALAVGVEVANALGKSQATGELPSQS